METSALCTEWQNLLGHRALSLNAILPISASELSVKMHQKPSIRLFNPLWKTLQNEKSSHRRCARTF